MRRHSSCFFYAMVSVVACGGRSELEGGSLSASVGSAASVGGSESTGGLPATSSGGFVPTGGRSLLPTGGRWSTGGLIATGGWFETWNILQTGGTKGTGGAAGTGGSSSIGGMPATGGMTAAADGGASTISKFACDTQLCTTDVQFCEVQRSDLDEVPDTYDCRLLPDKCFTQLNHPSCDCIVKLLCPSGQLCCTCTNGENPGEITVTYPGG